MNAIILAAGKGTRLSPLTDTTPKSLVKVGGQPIIERQIKYLIQKGINNIVIVTGYMHEKFVYLKDKYGVQIVFNEKYDTTNNIYSMYLVRDYLEDSYVLEADVFMTTNFFERNISNSTYFVGYKIEFHNEWVVKFNKDHKVCEISVDNGTGFIMSGISFWSKKDCLIIRRELEEAILDSDMIGTHWDNIIKDNQKKIDIYVKEIQASDWFEIDTLKDFEKAVSFVSK